MNIQNDASLKPFNTFGIDANARFFTRVTTLADLRELISDKRFSNLTKLILGGGSNILLTRNVDGLVIRNELKGISKIKETDSHVWIRSGAGEVWHELVMYCIENNYGGIENLSLIPGSVGAGPMQNIGAYGVELKDTFDQLEALQIQTGEVIVFDATACEFGYRQSIFKGRMKNQYIITSVTLKLTKKHQYNISYGAIDNELKRMGAAELSLRNISNAVINIRRGKLPDPAFIGNAGSFFKNPEVSSEHYLNLKSTYPATVGYEHENGNYKLAAGWLIEQCGWKGKVVGHTGSHKDQALVLVNYGGATGIEVYTLAQNIQQSVKEKFGVELEMEVNII